MNRQRQEFPADTRGIRVMTAGEVRDALRLLYHDSLWRQAKRQLALALGYAGRSGAASLRSKMRGGWLFKGEIERLSHKIGQILRGEVALEPTGESGPGRQQFRVVYPDHPKPLVLDPGPQPLRLRVELGRRSGPRLHVLARPMLPLVGGRR